MGGRGVELVQRRSVIDSRNEQVVTSTLWVTHFGPIIDPFSYIYLCIFAAFTMSIATACCGG